MLVALTFPKAVVALELCAIVADKVAESVPELSLVLISVNCPVDPGLSCLARYTAYSPSPPSLTSIMSPSLILESAYTAAKLDFLNVALAPVASEPIPKEPTYFAPVSYTHLTLPTNREV